MSCLFGIIKNKYSQLRYKQRQRHRFLIVPKIEIHITVLEGTHLGSRCSKCFLRLSLRNKSGMELNELTVSCA